jgi:ATP-dependent helicase/nuclease subunit A
MRETDEVMTKTLELVRAGAGAGKTYDLCETVAQAVAEGLDPARILATTFTKKAAAELKGRVQAKLRSMDTTASSQFDASDRFELAAIGTVHSVAHQLLSRYAIEMGLSPRLEVILEDVAEVVLSALVGNASSSDSEMFGECSKRLGITEPHKLILELLSAVRGNRISDDSFREQMQISADRVCGIIAPQGTSDNVCTADELLVIADEAKEGIRGLENDATKVTAGAISALQALPSPKNAIWTRYLVATKIKAGKSSGADSMLDGLRNAASKVRQHPKLHADVLKFSQLLTEATLELASQYEAHKRERGLIDYTDLELLLLNLLEDEAIAVQVSEDFELVLVDEFQDTNPLQLEIFQNLRLLSARSRWVGDSNQAIYGFRDTDPELIENVWSKATDKEPDNLLNNWRSQKGLVQFVGELFAPLFGEKTRQNPKKEPHDRGVERWLLQTKNAKQDADSLAGGIAQLHAEGTQYGDIAVVERANSKLVDLSQSFEDLGIPYLLESAGLLRTREAALVFAGFRLVADRSDSLAAATVLHILADPEQDTPDWIIERLESLQTLRASETDTGKRTYPDPWEGDERFRQLDLIDKTVSSPTVVLQQVIEALSLSEHISRWGDAPRRCANLDSLLRHSGKYEETQLGSGHAATLCGFAWYMGQLADENMDLRYPPLGHDAVTLMTYHGTKGLEWPVVVLSGLDKEWPPRMWSPVVGGGGQNPERPLEGRELQCWIWPFGESKSRYGNALIAGSGLENDALETEEGIARAERETTEGQRLLYVGCTRAKSKLVFVHREGKCRWLDKVPRFADLIDSGLEPGEHEIAGVETTVVVRKLDQESALKMAVEQKPEQRWIASAEIKERIDYADRFYSPSVVGGVEETEGDGNDDSTFAITDLPGKSYCLAGVKEEKYADVGNAVHGYFGALPSMVTMDTASKSVVAERCLSAFQVTGVMSPEDLVATGDRFWEWVSIEYPSATWHTEVPATCPRSSSGQWNGTLDLVLQLANGGVVIIDHKSAPVKRDVCAKHAANYADQLLAYREMLAASGHDVHSCWVHFPLAGVMAKQIAQ